MSENATKGNRAPKKAAKDNAAKMRDVVLSYRGKDYHVKMRDHIPVVERTLLLNKVEDLYFIGGEYDPAYGDLAAIYVLSRMYTDQDFGDDIDRFEMFATETDLQDYLPDEAVELFGYVQEKVDFLTKKKATSDEEAAFYQSVRDAATSVKGVMDSITAYLEHAAKSFEGENRVSFDEISTLLKALNRMDEKKITDAIIDYQAEKAKREKSAAGHEPLMRGAEKK